MRADDKFIKTNTSNSKRSLSHPVRARSSSDWLLLQTANLMTFVEGFGVRAVVVAQQKPDGNTDRRPLGVGRWV